MAESHSMIRQSLGGAVKFAGKCLAGARTLKSFVFQHRGCRNRARIVLVVAVQPCVGLDDEHLPSATELSNW